MLEAAILCLALNVYHEARGEPFAGQHAVAQVTLNRAQGDPSRVCDEVFRPKQFSWTNPLLAAPSRQERKKTAAALMPKEKSAWLLAKLIAVMNIKGIVPDVAQGSNHYHARKVRPSWGKRKWLVLTIGNHHFYRLPSVSAN